MAKAFAMLTIFCSGTFAGARMAGLLQRRLRALKCLESFFRRLLTLMEYTRAPLGELVQRVERREDNPLIRTFGERLQLGDLPSDAWRAAFEQSDAGNMGLSSLTKKDLEIMDNFISTLGTSGLRSQKEYAGMLFAELEEAISDAERSYTGKAKLYRYIGMLGGAAVAILLL